jgi:nucleoside phosphorylase/glycosyltransferase involved in cell wall biosynthesis|nr:glycosyltransferase [Neorhizobium tomejilense]
MAGERFIFLMNGWASAAGGIQTVNRELVCALAKARPNAILTVIVPTASHGEFSDAKARNVHLIAADGVSSEDWMPAILSPAFQEIVPNDVVAVVGHSHFSGAVARLVRDRFFPKAALVQFIHMTPLRTEALKEYRKDSYVAVREEKVRLETELAMNADIVICVGPRLHRFTRDALVARGAKDSTIHSLNCGLSPPSYPRVPPIAPTILCLGRTESLGVKGLDIFAYAAGFLMNSWMSHPTTSQRPAPTFVVRGTKDDGEALEVKLASLAAEVGAKPHFVARPYTTEQDELTADYMGSSIFVMPSREEGFGLVACEALSQGVPVLLSTESGVAEVVRSVIHEHHMRDNPCLVPMHGDPREVGRRFAEAALDILVNEGTATDYYQVLRERLLPVSSWEAGAARFLQIVDDCRGEVESTPSNASPTPATRPAPSGLSQQSINDLMGKKGVVAVSLKQAVVVVVEKGSNPNLPVEIDGMEVVVREIDSVRFSAKASLDKIDGVIVENSRRASIALILVGPDGNLYALTAAHAVRETELGDVSLRVNSAVVPALGVVKSLNEDWALLQIPNQRYDSEPFAPIFPAVEESVEISIENRKWSAVVSAIDVTARISSDVDYHKVYEHLLEIRVDGALPPGASGALVLNSHQQPLAMIIASIVGTDGAVTSLYAIPLSSIHALQNYSVARFRPEQRRRRALRVGVITTTVEDLATLVSAGSINWTSNRSEGMSSVIGEMDHGLVEIFATATGRFGPVATAIATADLLATYQPDVMIHLGLCAGLRRQEQSLGDVVISSEVISFANGALSSGELRHNIQIFEQKSSRMQFMLALQPIQERISGAISGTDGVHVHMGQFASVDYVVKSHELADKVFENSRHALALDMESSGFSQAVQTLGRNRPTPLMLLVKGISDFPDDKYGSDFSERANTRRLASMNASLAAIEIIRVITELEV